MKLLARADDLGLCEAVNDGIIKTVKEGIVRNCGLMSNMEFARQGVQLLAGMEVSIGLHVNMSVGTPVSDPKLIPSLVDPFTERFYGSKEICNRENDTIVLQEAILETEEQLKKFISLTGKLPAYIDGHAISSQHFFEAVRFVARKHHLLLCDSSQEEWKHYGIYWCTKRIVEPLEKYDPLGYLMNDEEGILHQDNALCVFHPGFIDQYLLEHSSYVDIRPIETNALCNERLLAWMREHHIELATFENYRT